MCNKLSEKGLWSKVYVALNNYKQMTKKTAFVSLQNLVIYVNTPGPITPTLKLLPVMYDDDLMYNQSYKPEN